MTPWKSTLPGVGANNPSIRLFEYDRDNGRLQRIKQYYLNLTQANIDGDPTEWSLEYDTSVDFAIDELSPRQLNELVVSFQDRTNRLFRQYLKFNSVQYDTEPTCNDTCYLRHICAITELDISDYRQCTGPPANPGPPPTTITTLRTPNRHRDTCTT